MRRCIVGPALAVAALAALGGSGNAQQTDSSRSIDAVTFAAVDTPHVRRRSIAYSDAYNTRLTIHRIGSYTMLPLFAGEWTLGNRLLNGTNPPGWMKPAHLTVATAIGALFAVNTVTGVWNLWDSRQDPADRPRRYIHAGLMLASDAGFLWASAIASNAKHDFRAGQRHRNVALGSIGLSTAGTALMWFWKR